MHKHFYVNISLISWHICFFHTSLSRSVWVKMEKYNIKLDDFRKLCTHAYETHTDGTTTKRFNFFSCAFPSTWGEIHGEIVRAKCENV